MNIFAQLSLLMFHVYFYVCMLWFKHESSSIVLFFFKSDSSQVFIIIYFLFCNGQNIMFVNDLAVFQLVHDCCDKLQSVHL